MILKTDFNESVFAFVRGAKARLKRGFGLHNYIQEKKRIKFPVNKFAFS